MLTSKIAIKSVSQCTRPHLLSALQKNIKELSTPNKIHFKCLNHFTHTHKSQKMAPKSAVSSLWHITESWFERARAVPERKGKVRRVYFWNSLPLTKGARFGCKLTTVKHTPEAGREKERKRKRSLQQRSEINKDANTFESRRITD